LSVLERNELEGFKASPYFAHVFSEMEMSVFSSTVIQGIRMLPMIASLLLRIWSVNYAQLP